MGLWQASQGSIRFGGQDITRATPQIAQLNIAYVPENMGIFADLTVKENMLLAARAARMRRRWTARAWTGSSSCSRPSEVLEPPGRQAQRRAKADAGRGARHRRAARC
jgi:ABC-type sugar transport system ATPase subunit